MTNDDKADLRRMVKCVPAIPDEAIVRSLGCSIATVRKYRRALAPVLYTCTATVNSDRREPVSYSGPVSRYFPRNSLADLVERAGSYIQRSGLDPVADNVTITLRFSPSTGDQS